MNRSYQARVKRWGFGVGQQVLSYRSGHLNNIFQARFLPQTNNSTVVTCAADGQVKTFSPHGCLVETQGWIDMASQDGPRYFASCTCLQADLYMQVRVGYLHRSDQNKASTSSLATHGSRAHKLALDPQTPQCFYSWVSCRFCIESVQVPKQSLTLLILVHQVLECAQCICNDPVKIESI